MSRHAFFPLLSYTLSSVRIGKDATRRTIVKQAKSRSIRYAAHVDAHIYSSYCESLALAYEAELQRRGLAQCVLAFRVLGQSNIEFAKGAFDKVRNVGDCVAMAFDVTGFFDHIDHGLLKQMWCRLIQAASLPQDHFALYKSLTRYSFVERDALFQALQISVHNPKRGRRRVCSVEDFRRIVRGGGMIKTNPDPFGIPQGTPISALLSNVYLLDFDAFVHGAATHLGGVYFRYCDDILILLPEGSESGFGGTVVQQLAQLKLEANPKKTEISRFRKVGVEQLCDRPLQYLGFTFDGKRILLRSAALAKYSAKMNKAVRLAKATARSKNAARVSNGQGLKPVYKRKLYERYSHLGRQNFVRYALRAASILNSQEIRRQVRPLWARLNRAIERT